MGEKTTVDAHSRVRYRFQVKGPHSIVVAVESDRPVWIMALDIEGWNRFQRGEIKAPEDGDLPRPQVTDEWVDPNMPKGVLFSSPPVFAYSGTIHAYNLSGWWYLLVGNRSAEPAAVFFDTWVS